MNREELFNMLELDTPEDFEYFEQFADLLECEDEISFDDFYLALSKADPLVLAEINENYFTELEKAFPEGCDDFLEIIQEIWNNLKLLLNDVSCDEYRKEYINQLYSFREMYIAEDGAMVDGKLCSVLNAIAISRESKIDNINHVFDFEKSLGYEPDYISMRLGGFEGKDDE